MNMISPLISVAVFDPTRSLDPGSLTEALFGHCRAVEEVLRAAGLTPNVDYAALDVTRIAATLMTAPDAADERFQRWLLPQPTQTPLRMELSADGTAMPF